MKFGKEREYFEKIITDIKWLSRFGDKKNSCRYVIMKSLLTFCEMLIIGYVGEILDYTVSRKDWDLILLSNIKIVVLVLLCVVFSIFCNKYIIYVKENPVLEMQRSVLDKIFELGVPFSDQCEKGFIFSLFHTTIPAIKNIYERHFPQIINNSISLMVAIFLFLEYSGKIGWIVLLFLLPNILIHMFFNKVISQMISVHIDKQQIFNKNIFSFLSSIREIRVYQSEAWQYRKIENSYRDYKNIKLQTLQKRYARGMFFRLNTALGVITYLILAVFAMNKNQLLFANFIACFFYCTSFIYVFNGLIFNITETLPSLQQVEVLKNVFQNQGRDSANSKEKINRKIKNIDSFENISIYHIDFGYYLGLKVLRDLSITINRGDKILLTGESGVGKTTLLKIIAGLYTINSGRIFWNQIDYNDIEEDSLRNRFGYLFQEPYLFGGSILENIRVGNRMAEMKDIYRAAKLAGVDFFVEKLPERYETVVGERGTLLSGGQRQRIAIARLILRNPEIIVLDEATSSLDKKTEKNIMDNIINEIFKDKTIIAVSHRAETFSYYNRIIYFDENTVKEVEKQEFLKTITV